MRRLNATPPENACSKLSLAAVSFSLSSFDEYLHTELKNKAVKKMDSVPNLAVLTTSSLKKY